jgi:hypothetical protein
MPREVPRCIRHVHGAHGKFSLRGLGAFFRGNPVRNYFVHAGYEKTSGSTDPISSGHSAVQIMYGAILVKSLHGIALDSPVRERTGRGKSLYKENINNKVKMAWEFL